MDEFIEQEKAIKKVRGALADYADPSLMEKEEGAWDRAMTEQVKRKTEGE